MSTEDNHALMNGHSNGKTVVSQTLTEEQVQQLRTWNFNILTIPTLEEKFKYTLGMFIDTNLFEVLGCSVEKFYGFLTKLSDMYDHRHNPFHNFNHGITVAHGIYYIIQHGVISKHLTKTETFALLFSALCHDVDHTGHSNSYETNSKSQLFELYGNESPLEKHHFAETVKLAEEFSLFENVPEEDLVTIKKFLRSNILATDMSKHNQIMNEFKDNLPCLLSSDHVITEQQKLNLCGALVHAADIGAPTRDFDISKEWSLRIAKEFLAQVELEKSNNLPVTPFYKDLDKFLTLATNEIGFISFFIKPFWVEIQNFGQGKLEQVTTNIDNNIQSWKDEKVKEESRIAEVKS